MYEKVLDFINNNENSSQEELSLYIYQMAKIKNPYTPSAPGTWICVDGVYISVNTLKNYWTFSKVEHARVLCAIPIPDIWAMEMYSRLL